MDHLLALDVELVLQDDGVELLKGQVEELVALGCHGDEVSEQVAA